MIEPEGENPASDREIPAYDCFLKWVSRLVLARSGLVLVVAAVLVAGSLGLASRLRLDTDVLSLVPRHNRTVDAFKQTLADFGSIDFLLVAVTVPPGETEAATQFAEILAGRLEAMPEIEYVDFRVENPSQYIETFTRRALLFLSLDEVRALAPRFGDAEIGRQIAKDRDLLTTPQSGIAKEVIKHDPLGLTPLLLGRFDRVGESVRMDLSSGYYLSPQRDMLILIAKPIRPAQDLDFAERLLAAVERAEASALEAYREEAESAWEPRVEYGGTYVIAVEDKKILTRDAILNNVISFVGVLALFIIAFRRPSIMALALLPLVVGLAATFGFAYLLFERLSTITSGAAALLVGLGIDFSVVMYGRFLEERRQGADLEAAIHTIVVQSGKAVTIGALTTAATFFAFLVTEFRGLFEFGLITGVGMLVCLVSVLFVLPAMLVWRTRRGASDPRRYPLRSFGSESLMNLAVRRPSATFAVCIILTLASLAGMARLRFDDDLQNMRASGNRGIELQGRVAEKFGTNFRYMMLVLEGKTEAEVLAANHRLSRQLDALVRSGDLATYDSVARLAPSVEQQLQVIEYLRGEGAAAFDPVRVEAAVRSQARAAGFVEGAFESFLRQLPETLQPRAPMRLEDFQVGALAKVVGRYVRTTPKGYKSVIYLYPPGGKWRRETPPSLRAIESANPGVTLTGINVVSQELRRLVWRDALVATGLGFVLVVILLYLEFRDWKWVGLALVPLLVGITWMLGAMGFLGIPMNMMSIFVTTMIIGIGVDYAIHMLHRYLEASGEVRIAELQETGKAVALAALTTLLGFGSLSLSSYSGLRAMGYVSTLGTAFTSILALTLLPAWFSKLRKRP